MIMFFERLRHPFYGLLFTLFFSVFYQPVNAADATDDPFISLNLQTKTKGSNQKGLIKYGRLTLRPISFSDLSGWNSDNQKLALPVFLRSCEVLTSGNGKGAFKVPGTRSQWKRVCRLAGKFNNKNTSYKAQETLRAFFQKEFQPFEVIDKKRPAGLFTGYYEPEVAGSRTKTGKYKYPLYAKPEELVRLSKASLYTGKHRHDWGILKNGSQKKYFTRKEIEKGALKGRKLELVYLENKIDAFFIHVQGSTRIRLKNGDVMRVGFAAKNGHPYKSIGRVLIDWGELDRHKVSMGSIRNWARKNPKRTNELLAHNRSFIFFRELKKISQDQGPLGAQGVPLTGGRSMAVDKKLHAYGVPMWIETFAPDPETKREKPYHRLMISQDTGSAIRGAVRGDIYLGTGKKAGKVAGMLKHPGRLILLVPHKH